MITRITAVVSRERSTRDKQDLVYHSCPRVRGINLRQLAEPRGKQSPFRERNLAAYRCKSLAKQKRDDASSWGSANSSRQMDRQARRARISSTSRNKNRGKSRKSKGTVHRHNHRDISQMTSHGISRNGLRCHRDCETRQQRKPREFNSRRVA